MVSAAKAAPAPRAVFGRTKYGLYVKPRLQYKGFPVSSLRRYAGMGVGFGAATAVALLLFMEEVPPVRRDIFEKIPIIGGYWTRSVPPEDNPY